MANVMPPQSLGLSVPVSRQDIISELLDDYTYSYDQEVASPCTPVPISKELPPPPPQAESQRDRKLEAIQRMNTKFQLRELDNATSPTATRKESLEQSPKRIVSRSLSRSGTPASLKLSISNGSTAALPPTPVVYAPVKPVPSSLPRASKELPPPPPPARSSRRKVAEEPTMGQHESKADLERNDSFHSQKDSPPAENNPTDTKNVAPPVQRKPLPGAGVKKFVSLLELNNGPRGSKVKPPPPTSAPRKLSVDKDVEQGHLSASSQTSSAPAHKEPLSISVNNQLPPTPPEDKSVLTPPRKALVGLPSNPRAKSPMSPLHVRGKSSTGFFLKAARPAPPPPMANNNVTTPEMTPSPTLKPEMRRDQDISPVTPLPPPTEQRRPFSYEPIAPVQVAPQVQAPQVQPQAPPVSRPQAVPEVQVQAAPEIQIQSVPSPKVQKELPQVQKELPEVQKQLPPVQKELPQVQAPQVQPSPVASSPAPAPTPPAKSPLPVTTAPEQPSAAPDTTSLPANAPTTTDAATEDDLPPFTPLTRQPYTHAPAVIPSITSAHLQCYTSHATTVWSNNRFQALGCMACQSNEQDRKWSCTWCQLRLCRTCSDELVSIPGRDLSVLLSTRAGAGAEGKEPAVQINVSDADEGANEYVDEDGDWDEDINAEYEQDRLVRMSSIEEEAEERAKSIALHHE